MGAVIYARSGVMDMLHDDRRVAAVCNRPRARSGSPAGIDMRFLSGARLRYTLMSAPSGQRRRGLETLEVRVLLGELIVHIVSAGTLDPAAAEHDCLAGVLMDLIAAARDGLGPATARRSTRGPPRRASRASPADARTLEVLASDAGASLRTLQRCSPKRRA